ncbi:ABC transporter substrate-binding protein [Paenibacillus sp. MCAF9]|uniref:ABC transporter substrate-binding protein n=1 Tax=unclassified Paenibacillus TaxID=185978 RepID=UPI003F9CF646
MDVEEYYCRLRNTFPANPEREPIFLSMERICDILSCTRRNVQILLTKMMEKSYIEWLPGRGRGNLSQIVFLVSYRDIVLGKAKGLVEKGKINEAWSMLEMLQDPAVKSEIMTWLSELFGVKRDMEEKDVLRFPFYRPLLRLDPAFVCRRMETHWIEQVFNTLVRYSNQDGKFHPQLAHYWESNVMKTSWTFFLRKGVRFHNDKIMTSRDVAFTFQRLLTSSPAEWLTSKIKEIKETSKYSITFELNEPNALFLHFLCTERYSIVPEMLDGTGSDEQFAVMPIGTGPFKITKNNESMLVAEANEFYLEGCPHLDRIEMWVWPNYEENQEQLQSDGEDQLVYFEAQIKESLRPALAQLEKGSTFITINTAKKGITQQMKFRQALHYGIDRQQMIHELGGIRHQPSTGFNLEDTDKAFYNDYDTQLAATLLEESGYKGETITLYTYEMPANDQTSKWLQRVYKHLGISLEIVKLSLEELANPEIIMKADMILSGEVLGEQPDISLIEMYMSKNSFITNHLGLVDKMNINQQISNCLRYENSDIRMGYLISIQEELKRNFSLLFLYHSLQIVGHHQTLQGISLNAWGKIDYKNVWLRNT